MKLLESKKFKLPSMYFITDRKEIKDLPIGVPFIYGAEEDEPYLVRILEYEILYQKAIKSGMPFNFKQILKDEGYELKSYEWSLTSFIDYATSSSGDDWDIDGEPSTSEKIDPTSNLLRSYINDAVAIVDIKKLKDLNVFPMWLDSIEQAVNTNIHNFATYDYNLYNKKLEGMYGNVTFTAPDRNVIIIDISPSIPKGVGATCLTMSKNLAESFYADIVITGRKTILVPYEELHTLDITKAYELWGGGQEGRMFRKLVSDHKNYKTAIVFGDNNHPGDNWDRGDRYLRDADGIKMCQWKVDKLISFHTDGINYIAGYGRWFNTKEIERIDNWVKYLN